MSYWDQAAFEQFLGKAVVLACTDDNNDGQSDPDVIARLALMADRRVDGRLATEWPDLSLPLENPPELVVSASLHWGKVYAFERRPEYVKRYGKTPREEANSLLDELITAKEYLTDALGISVTPANVGGVVVDGANRIYITDPTTGQSNAGDY